jgi:CRISPR-associated endonuclease/helicase Cas3
MSNEPTVFWAKTCLNSRGQEVPGISVIDHCLNVGWVAHWLVQALPNAVRSSLPGHEGQSAAVLAAAHDIGKLTLGFQIRCSTWPIPVELGESTLVKRESVDSVSDHALVSQVFLQSLLKPKGAQLWSAAVGAHHGRPKGRHVKQPEYEARREWAEQMRNQVIARLIDELGPLPETGPNPKLGPAHSDLWLLAGLITVADWIASNEAFFPADRGLSKEEIQVRVTNALTSIGWPGGKLKATPFSVAFTGTADASFKPNSIQEAVGNVSPGLLIVEAPMGSGKTEAALRAAQQWIADGHQQGIYFALPTQTTSNRIHRRVAQFLGYTLDNPGHLRLAHGNSWLEQDSSLLLKPSHGRDPIDHGRIDQEYPYADVREARSWFASSKHSLLSPYGVGTIDQALQAMVAVKHFFVRRFALAGKVVILDEIHSYDIYTGTLVAALVRELLDLGCSVIVLSATLTAKRRQELLAAARCEESSAPESYPLITSATRGNPVIHLNPQWPSNKNIALRSEAFSEAAVLDELIQRAEAGQHVLWIRNTVIDAQSTFAALRSQMAEGEVMVGLLHSRFPFARRQELENLWLDRLGKDRAPSASGSILIATQVVEQSVDIDLDFIVSDLAPTDMLLQRMGRLWRHDRPSGHRAAAHPEFWVRLPELNTGAAADELKSAMGRSARVYAPYVLLRSAAVWSARTRVHLPADIRGLLEATYSEREEAEPTPWTTLHRELEAEKKNLKANADAAMSVLGLPMLNSEADGVLTRRKGPPTVPVVILSSVVQLPAGRGWGLTALDGSEAKVSDFEWQLNVARFLHQWLVRIPKWQVPPTIESPKWLAEHISPDAVVAVLEEDGHLRFSNQAGAISYHQDFGVFAEKPTKTKPEPEPWSDDDDEFDP